MAMFAAEELGIPYEAVQVTTGDTDATTDAGGPGASRGTASVGLAVIAAARDAKIQLLDAAADQLKKKKEELEIMDGQIFINGENKSVPYQGDTFQGAKPDHRSRVRQGAAECGHAYLRRSFCGGGGGYANRQG